MYSINVRNYITSTKTTALKCRHFLYSHIQSIFLTTHDSLDFFQIICYTPSKLLIGLIVAQTVAPPEVVLVEPPLKMYRSGPRY